MSEDMINRFRIKDCEGPKPDYVHKTACVKTKVPILKRPIRDLHLNTNELHRQLTFHVSAGWRLQGLLPGLF